MNLKKYFINIQTLALLSVAYLVISFYIQETQILLWVTALLIILNFVLSLTYLFSQGRITLSIIFLNLVQLALFCRLHLLIYDLLGTEHYYYELQPHWYDWIELIAVHVLRALDVLDIFNAYGINLQNLTAQSTLARLTLVTMHIMVDIFLMGAIIMFIQRHSSSIVMKKEDFWGSVKKTLKYLRYLAEISLIILIVYIALINGWGLKNSWWWVFENFLRTLDIGDAFEIFDWQIHALDMNLRMETLGVFFRLLVGVYALEVINSLYLHLSKGRGKTIEELAKICTSSDKTSKKDRRVAINALSKIGSSSVVPYLIMALSSKDRYIRHTAAQALKKIDPQWQNKGTDGAIKKFVTELTSTESDERRAAIEALGILRGGATDAIPELVKTLADSHRQVRIAAANALKKIDPQWPQSRLGEHAISELVRKMIGNKTDIRRTSAEALALMEQAAIQSIPYFIKAFAYCNRISRKAAADALIDQGTITASAIPDIVTILAESNSQIQQYATSILSRLDGKAASQAVPALLTAINSHHRHIRSFGITVLGNLGVFAREAIPKLVTVLGDTNAEVRIAAAEALGKIDFEWSRYEGVKTAIPFIVTTLAKTHQFEEFIAVGINPNAFLPLFVTGLKDKDINVRCATALLLGKMGPSAAQAVPDLASALDDEDNTVRRIALNALGKIGPSAAKALPIIVTARADKEETIRQAAKKALDKIEPEWRQSKALQESYQFFIEFGFKTSLQ